MPPSEPIVYIVDDDELTLRYFHAVLSGGGLTCNMADSAAVFLEQYDRDQPGCLLLDVQMPGMSGLMLQQRLNLSGAVIPVLFISAHADVPMVIEALGQGAYDFIQKPVAEDDLLARVRKALDYDAENRLVLQHRESLIQRFQTLTPRERDVLALLMAGHSNKTMAGDLQLSQRTVELHRARVMEKTGSRSLAQLIRMAMDSDFLHPPPP
jgi:two-component system response regulator FixJ